MDKIVYRDLGVIPYKAAWEYQETLFRDVMERKLRNTGERYYPLLFCEHPPVFTLGKNGSPGNLLIDEEALAKRGIEFYRINRGGDITYHGPGQIVGYPILDLEDLGLGIRKYIYVLEEAVINLLYDFGIPAGRLYGATGVWLEPDSPNRARKICAIGVRASRHVTMHGFAFNVNTDLSYYHLINPCGFTDKGVTSMKKETGQALDIQDIKSRLKTKLLVLLNSSAHP
jgi:lipoyl(octanoyl) transferase